MAIDPGNVQSAYTFMNEHNKILMKGKADNYHVLGLIRKNRNKITHMVCEMIAQYGMGVGASTFHTCVWIGEFKREFAGNTVKHKDFYLLYRKSYVSYICNDTRAKDGDVRQAMVDRYGEPGTMKHPGPTYGFTKDMWQSLAIASYFVDRHKENKYPEDIEQKMIDEYYSKIEERKEKAKSKNAVKKSRNKQLSESSEQ